MGVTLSIVLIAAVIEAVGILLVGSLCYWCRRKWAHLLWFCVHRGRIHPAILPCQFLSRCVCSPFRMDLRGLQYGADAVSARSHLPGRGRDCPLLSTSLQNIEREMNEDYAVYARCRGLSDMRILWTHALPHALAGLAPSFLQMVGISLAGSAIVEKIFSLPGLGYSIVDSVLYRDTPMIHATILFLAFFLVICNAVSDILQRIFQRGHAEGAVQ